MFTPITPTPVKVLGIALIFSSLGLIIALGYRLSSRSITVLIDDQPYIFRTDQNTIGEALQAEGFPLAPADLVEPHPDMAVESGMIITVSLARPIQVEVDGKTETLLTQEQSISQILNEANIHLAPHDAVWLNDHLLNHIELGHLPDAESILTKPPTSNFITDFITPKPTFQRASITRLRLKRATQIALHENSYTQAIYTVQETVGQALQQAGVTLHPEDILRPKADTAVSSGLQLYLIRATPLTVTVDGRTMQIRTHQDSIGAALSEAGILLMGQDFSHPAVNQAISATANVEVVRVQETIETVNSFIPFETEWQASDELHLDQQVILKSGQAGIVKTRFRVRYENGEEQLRVVEDEWLDQQPESRRVAYGTKIILQTLQTELGEITYWRKISVLTTAYSAATSGKPRDHPNYGITRTGERARYGLVAVDPRVIALKTQLYIPSYGRASAEDTGGGVLGKHVDLGFDEDVPPPIYGWREVYLLPPIPPAHQIRYVLPEWPQSGR
ncbi:ubiquitin-like domain-containing protein [Anaerolineales bacterium HSG25]|nr:ubiquitin-like domain-containing protein [Anaerolineales bacterium HSG25]